MACQLREVRKVVSTLANVKLQVLPFSAGAHQLLGGSAAILQFGGTADPDVLYTEGFASGYEDRPAVVDQFRARLEGLGESALDEQGSIDMIDRILKDYDA